MKVVCQEVNEGMYEGILILMAIHEASKALDRLKHIFFIDKTWKQKFFILLFNRGQKPVCT